MRYLNSWASARLVFVLSVACAGFDSASGQLIDARPLPRESGLSELVILDPATGTSDAGAPAVIYNEETNQVEIPPVLHVHRYYYSGDREYQGPLIGGGPTIVVAQHPATGKQVYVDVMLPAGAPEIAYTRQSISYVYEDRRIVISFSHLRKEHVKVAVIHGRGPRRVITEKAHGITERLKAKRDESGLVNSLRESAASHRNRIKGVIGLSQGAVAFAVDKTGELVRIVPGAQMLQSLGEQADEEAARQEIRHAALEKQENEQIFIDTIR